jgi:hypothetical protein
MLIEAVIYKTEYNEAGNALHFEYSQRRNVRFGNYRDSQYVFFIPQSKKIKTGGEENIVSQNRRKNSEN